VVRLGEIKSAILAADEGRDINVKSKLLTEEFQGHIIAIIAQEVDSWVHIAGHAVVRDVLVQCQSISRRRNTAAGVICTLIGTVLGACGFVGTEGRVHATTGDGARCRAVSLVDPVKVQVKSN
jgi:hypothetical protein